MKEETQEEINALQAAKIRFLMTRIVAHTDHDEITAEFMERSLNGQRFEEF